MNGENTIEKNENTSSTHRNISIVYFWRIRFDIHFINVRMKYGIFSMTTVITAERPCTPEVAMNFMYRSISLSRERKRRNENKVMEERCFRTHEHIVEGIR